MVFTSEEMEKAFWNKVDRKEDHSECWNWKGACDKKTGYGVFRVRLGNNGTDVAHRVIYKHIYGEPPANKPVIRHLCNNRKCVNPRHLEAGTYRDNWEDSVKAGTARPFHVGHTPWNKGKKMTEVGIKLKARWKERKSAAHPEVMQTEDKDELLDVIVISIT